jgi:predicted AAA+ superfamily ATPase
MESKDAFNEWTTYSIKKSLIERDFNIERIIRNSERNISAVSGIRRAGKSSTLILILQNISKKGKKSAYINLEDNRIKNKEGILDEIIKWFGDEGYLLLDEITSVPGWEDWLSRTHELLKSRLHLFVSSSRAGLSTPIKPLRGRIIPFELYPLSFSEFLKFNKIKIEKTTSGLGKLETALLQYLNFGGFPEVVLAKDDIDKVMLLNAYFKDILALDVADMAHEDVGIVKAFGRYVLASTYFSASKSLNFFKSTGLKIGKEKILSLERFSEDAYLFFFVPIFSFNIKDASQYPRKAYSGDIGFFYGVVGMVDVGKRYENLVFLELKRRLQGQMQIRYWKNKEGAEVDFIVKQGANIKDIIQVCYDLTKEKTRARELNSAVLCAKEFGKKSALIITQNEKGSHKLDGITVKLVPLMDWLLG